MPTEAYRIFRRHRKFTINRDENEKKNRRNTRNWIFEKSTICEGMFNTYFLEVYNI